MKTSNSIVECVPSTMVGKEKKLYCVKIGDCKYQGAKKVCTLKGRRCMMQKGGRV